MTPEMYEKRLTRERQARAAAEALLESKSAELFDANEQLKKTASELELQSSQLSAIFDNALAGICVADADRTIVSANAYAHRVLGYDEGKLAGKTLTEVFCPKYIASTGAVGLEAVDLSKRTGEETTGTTSVNDLVPLEMSPSELYLGEQRFTLWIFYDITQRKADEAAHKQLEEELRQAQKLESLGTLASGIAHEINTPVQFIGDNLHFLADALRELLDVCNKEPEKTGAAGQESEAAATDLEYFSTEVPDAITQSIEGIDRISEIVSAVRDFSHPGTKEKSEIELQKAIESTITIARNQWKYVAELETEFDPEAQTAYCVPGEFNQVIVNLIVNAAEAIGDSTDSGRGHIKVSTASVENGIEIRVADNGCGIPLDVQPNIFDPFFTTKDVGKGTGQGLSLVHSIVVQKHGGRIRFETAPDSGTTFVVFLPHRTEDITQHVA